MKKYFFALSIVVTLFGLTLFTTTVFGGGGGMGGASSSGSKTTFTSNTPSGTTGYNTNAQGQVTGSFSTNCGNCSVGGGSSGGGGGGGNYGGGGGGGGQPQPRACAITLSAPVIASGTPSMALAWTPTPNGKVTLIRTGPSSRNRTNITLADNAKSYTDVTSALLPGTYTYSISYKKAAGVVRGESTSTVADVGEVVKEAHYENSHEQESIDLEPVSSFLNKIHEFAFGFSTPVYADHQPGGASGDPNSGRGDGSHSDGRDGGSGSSGGGGGSTSGYSCTASFKVVATLTQCNDGVDNTDSEDTLLDQQDPGCHTDGNPGNPKTYDPTDTSELNPPADLVPTITAVNTASIRQPVRVTASVRNTSAFYAVSNSLVYGWRDTSATARAPRCGRRNRNCFTENGHTFLRLNTYTRAYNPGQIRQDRVRTFRPPVKGRYEVCAIADFTNTVVEGSAGEANNRTCRIIVVDDTTTTTPTSTIDGPLTITASPSLMRRGQTSTVKWDTGGRTLCSITNTTSEAISFMDIEGDPRITDEEVSPALMTQTTYTITCTDPGYEATETAAIRILPEFREI